MGKKKKFTGFGMAFTIAIAMSLLLVYLAAARASYSQTGYTLTHYPGKSKNDFQLCTEGEVHPNQAYFVLTPLEDSMAVNPFVKINDKTYSFETALDKEINKSIQLMLGCNQVTYGASKGGFKLEVRYLSHYRPRVEYLEAINLRAGKENKFFISTDEEPMQTRLEIYDVTRNMRRLLVNKTFPGSQTEAKIVEPGNLQAYVQVYDGHVYSDIYEAPFSIHVVTTSEQKKMHRTFEVPDDEPLESQVQFVKIIQPDEGGDTASIKRFFHGSYILNHRLKNYLQYQAGELGVDIN